MAAASTSSTHSELLHSNLVLDVEDSNVYSDEALELETDVRFDNFALLSHLAARLRDSLPRGTHVKGSIPYPGAFTGKELVVRIHSAHVHGTERG
jgi:hypothetical protein